ncbi:MFS transporter [Ornatilinea apprima]|uniref:MFS transporter n=1 Tax=Ornatilinea apprima TaxID=1134406 RepID=A0A0P6X463_9CHLR|nr:MFS transporter [Ornatilinea apprima]KPL77851.1 MFS transporter [Ornatilinea apprima]
MSEKEHKRAITSWTLYDWANSTFATTIAAAVLPVYYSTVASSNLEPNVATSNWAFTTSIALILVAILGPILGAMADFSGAKKKFLTAFVLAGVTGTALLFFVRSGDWLMASLFFIIGNVGFAGANVFYDSLLPHIARPEEIDQVSSRGYAMGYLGGGLLLAVNLGMIMFTPDSQTELMTRLSFLSVAVWWLIFTIPLWKYVPEPTRRILEGEKGSNPFQASFGRLAHTFSEIQKYKQLSKFIAAFWLYNNGIGTIIYMASIYGAELQFSTTTIIGTLLMVQFVAIPFAYLFGWLAKKLGTKRSILLSLFIYTLIAIGGYFLTKEIHFWILGFAVATVQGGSQALSRSLCGRMMPKSKSAEFYSFFSISEKIAGTVGPLLFGLVSRLMGGSRLSIVSLIIFFAAGGLLLTRVDEKEAIAVAEVEEDKFMQLSTEAAS